MSNMQLTRQLKIAQPLHLLRRPALVGDIPCSHYSGTEPPPLYGDIVDTHQSGPPQGSGFAFDDDDWGVGLGYRCDVPDHRDLTLSTVKPRLKSTHQAAITRSRSLSAHRKKTPGKVDRIRWRGSAVWPVEQQGALHSCTAHAVVALVECLTGRAHRSAVDLSRLFLYKTTRTLEHSVGDSGATLRGTLRAVDKFGLPPEEYWAYVLRNFDVEPGAFLYSFAANYGKLNYTRLDDGTGDQTLDAVKRVLADGLPIAFGFPVYSSISRSPEIPLPGRGDRVVGGHAVLAVGYDDHHFKKDGGALIFRNSWGPQWGDKGYGYLPYEYIRRQWAADFWTAFRADWLDRNDFASTNNIMP